MDSGGVLLKWDSSRRRRQLAVDLDFPVRVDSDNKEQHNFGDLERVSVQPGRLMRALDTR